MRFLRFLSLFSAALAVLGAQYLFGQADQDPLFPPYLVELVPFLARLNTLPSGDLRNLGFLLAVIGALLFGEGAARWPRWVSFARERTARPLLRSGRLGVGLQVGALVFAGGLLAYFWRGGPENTLLHLLWLSSLAIYLLGAFLGERSHPLKRTSPSLVPPPGPGPASPGQRWPLLFPILLVVGLLVGWQLSTMPLRVDGDPASHGLQALEIVSDQEQRIFAPGWANIPLLAYYPAAWGMASSGDWLVGNRLAGVYAGLLTVLGVWLLGCELFRDGMGAAPESSAAGADAGFAPLLAAALTGIGYTFVHFSRMPQYMEPVAWGTLSLWAIHRGVRVHSRPTLAVGGLLLGVTGVLYYSGRVFYVIAVLWWLWFLFSRRGWLRALGWGGLGNWLGGMFVLLAPFLGIWMALPQAFLTRMREVFILQPDALTHMKGVYGAQGMGPVLLENARRVALTFHIYGDTSTHFGWPGPMLDTLSGALLILGVGYLLLNLDRLLSWQLLSWLVLVLLLGGVATTNAPFWPRLLPVLPVIGLIGGLVADRWRASMGEIGGPWLRSWGQSILVGLVVLAAITNWVNYYEWATVRVDPASAVGRAVRSLPDGSRVYLVDTGDPGRPLWGQRVVDFLAGGPQRPLQRETLFPGVWPEALPPGSTVLLLPGDQSIAAELQTRYPGGVYLVQRNRRGDPILFVYQVKAN